MMPPTNTTLSLPQLQKLASGKESVQEHVVDLLGAMQDSDEEIRAWASDALETLETLPNEVAESVAQQCLSPHAATAAWACKLLTKLGSEATNYQASVVACLTDHPSLSARQQAALALGSIPCLTATAVDALRSAVDSDDPRLKRLAANALASSGN